MQIERDLDRLDAGFCCFDILIGSIPDDGGKQARFRLMPRRAKWEAFNPFWTVSIARIYMVRLQIRSNSLWNSYGDATHVVPSNCPADADEHRPASIDCTTGRQFWETRVAPGARNFCFAESPGNPIKLSGANL
jgi:hypothetical protein